MELSLKIYGMDCAACAGQVTSVLRKIPGIDRVRVNFGSSCAEIESRTFPDLSVIEKKLERFGYLLPKEKVVIKTDSTLFSTKLDTLREQLPALALVEEKVENIILYLYPVGCRGNEIIAVFREEGLPIEIIKWESGNEEALAQDQVGLLRKLVLSVFLTLPLLWNPSPFFQFLLATLILLIPARVFFRGALRAFHGGMNMDVLIAVSSCLVYGYSTYLAFTETEDIKLYFLCEGVLVCLVQFGRYLEIVARGETERSLRGFISLLPRQCRLVTDKGEICKDVDEIAIGDLVVVEAGERIPVDGTVIKGNGLADESLLTGESALVTKDIGSETTGGTLLRAGALTIQVTKIGKETSLEQMIDIVRQAQISASPIRKLADTIVSFFIPAVIAIAFIVFDIWYFVADPGNLQKALLCCVGVLVVSCPCALGLAIPTSIMVGSGRCSELGILFKSAAAIEKMHKVKVIAFDKTGTLTCGGETSARNILRTGVPETVSQLSATHKTVMISGDKEEIAGKVGAKAGIERIYSEIKPDGKADVIRKLKKEGSVMMVGDGVNDAPAMAVSDLSVSIQNGTELAKDTADVILLGDEISKLPLAFSLADKIMKNIYENLLWALLYNVVCIPLAAVGLINPSLASAAMSFSSIAVLMNALRLKNMQGNKSVENFGIER